MSDLTPPIPSSFSGSHTSMSLGSNIIYPKNNRFQRANLKNNDEEGNTDDIPIPSMRAK